MNKAELSLAGVLGIPPGVMISTTPSLGVPRYTGAPASGASYLGSMVGVLLGTGPPTDSFLGVRAELRQQCGVELHVSCLTKLK